MRVVLPPEDSGLGALVCRLRRVFLGAAAAHKDVLAAGRDGRRLYYCCIRCGRVSNG